MEHTPTTPQPTKRQIAAARDAWRRFRADFGFSPNYAPRILGTPQHNAKLDGSTSTLIPLSLAQARTAGINVCKHSTPDCRAACVGKNGNGAYPATKRARIARTRFWATHPALFCLLVHAEIAAAVAKHGEVGFRLNTFSDIDWQVEAPEWFSVAGATFYDYTKDWSREVRFNNYKLAYSATEWTSTEQIREALRKGSNVAVVLNVRGAKLRGTDQRRPIPATFHGMPMIDADIDDDWTTKHSGVIGGLRAKGSMFGRAMAHDPAP